MNENSTLSTTGLYTNWGMEITKLHRFEHDAEGHWWAVCDLKCPEYRSVHNERPVDLCRMQYDHADKVADENMRAISRACMEYLGAHGEFRERGTWHPHDV